MKQHPVQEKVKGIFEIRTCSLKTAVNANPALEMTNPTEENKRIISIPLYYGVKKAFLFFTL